MPHNGPSVEPLLQESERAEWQIVVCPKCGAQENDPPSDCVYCETGGALKTITVVEKA